MTDIFKFDPKYLENEERYKSIKAEILGEESDDESGSGSDEDDSGEEEGKYYVLYRSLFIQSTYFQSWNRG
jgi:hypothetical protein